MLSGIQASNLPPAAPPPRRLPRSYAASDNSMVLWSSVWGEDKEGGLCTGLPQDEWMRLTIKLRDT